MTTPAPSRIKGEILQALELLGGYATIDQIVAKAGYNRQWCTSQLAELYEVGILQRSLLLPALYSLTGKPLAPRVTHNLDRKGVLDLAKYAAHINGRRNPEVNTIMGNLHCSNVLGFGTVERLIKLTGYKMLLVPIEETQETSGE